MTLKFLQSDYSLYAGRYTITVRATYLEPFSSNWRKWFIF